MVKQVMYRFGCSPNSTLDCPMCNSEVESVDHLFLHCRLSTQVWSSCMAWWDVSWCANKTFLGISMTKSMTSRKHRFV